MANVANFLQRSDQALADLFSQWGLITSLLALLVLILASYPLLYPDEPDTHPLLLARQAQPAPIRKKNESAAYRSPEVVYGNPLRSGLNVKSAGAPRWANGKDGDLRDVWREVQKGGKVGEDGKEVPKGAIMTIHGKEDVVEHDIEGWSKEINVIGKHLKDAGVKKVAIYLPNGVEYLSTIFGMAAFIGFDNGYPVLTDNLACAFYGLTPILLPYNQPHPNVYKLVNDTAADALICAAGNLPLDHLAEQCQQLRCLTWVVEKTSRHMDWSGIPESASGRLTVSVWHDVVDEAKDTASADLPSNEQGEKPGDLIAVWQPTTAQDAQADIVTFTQGNLVAAISALISALPLRQRFTPADLVLPADTFTHTYILCQTLAALFTHASLAINSVASPGIDLALASRSVSPTVILASAETMAALHAKETAGISTNLQKLGQYNQSQALTAGRMPTDNLLFRMLAPSSSAAGNEPGKLRLILTSERLGAGSPAISSTMLFDLRIFTRARICYALTAARVAGAVAQTNVFDYRRDDGSGHAHFGMPLSCVEVKLKNRDEKKVSGNCPEGEIVVMGPAVSGSAREVDLGVQARFREDGVLELV